MAVAKVPHVDVLESLGGCFAFGLAGAVEKTQARVSAHQDGVEDAGGEVAVEVRALLDISDCAALLGGGLAVEGDGVAGRGAGGACAVDVVFVQDLEHRLHEGGFA